MNDNFGLKEGDIEQINFVLGRFKEVEEALIFGSRAIGKYKNGSDVDVALKGDLLTAEILSTIRYILNEETSLPYKFDVLNYHLVLNENLTEHIDRVGIVIYKKTSVVAR